MARGFVGSLFQRLWHTTAIVTGAPFTVAGWFNAANVDDQDIIFALGNVVGARWELFANGTAAGDPLTWLASDGDSSTCSTTSGYLAATWHHACAIETAVDARAVLLDGGSKGTNSDSRNPAGVDDTTLGAAGRLANYFTGNLAEWAAWSAALTDEEVAVLATGISPLLVRPQNLVAYWPLIRDTDDDIVGGYSMTPYNSPTVAAHPRVIYPGPKGLVIPAVAAEGGYFERGLWRGAFRGVGRGV